MPKPKYAGQRLAAKRTEQAIKREETRKKKPSAAALARAKRQTMVRCPTCAALVNSIFDHVDKDCAHD